ncbi:DUF6461 domain-containing protein [Actinocorallia populi]|uniref:DUF6461 domain-containing protein n=1 Tax=Actinocorallia populi TaxID=2079200 RepID=UPI000D097A81|nr:DUF6461 domain-containing protein [Actinocorallia populi]
MSLIDDYAWWASFPVDFYGLALFRLPPDVLLERLHAVDEDETDGFGGLVGHFHTYLGATPDRYLSDFMPAGVVEAAGTDGSWTLLFELGGLMSASDFSIASESSMAVAHYLNGAGDPGFTWYLDGKIRTAFQSFGGPRYGAAPTGLDEPLARLGLLDPSNSFDVPWGPGQLALTEELSGIRITEELLRGSRYRTALIPMDDEARRRGPFRRVAPAESEIRDWARGVGIKINDHGAIPASIVEQYEAVHQQV